jgi:hypothetical protein
MAAAPAADDEFGRSQDASVIAAKTSVTNRPCAEIVMKDSLLT